MQEKINNKIAESIKLHNVLIQREQENLLLTEELQNKDAEYTESVYKIVTQMHELLVMHEAEHHKQQLIIYNLLKENDGLKAKLNYLQNLLAELDEF